MFSLDRMTGVPDSVADWQVRDACPSEKEGPSMRSFLAILAAILLLATGCTTGTTDKNPADACHAGGGVQCHDMVEQNKGGQNNGGGGMGGGGMGGGSGGGMM
jgi:hypothetical protein